MERRTLRGKGRASSIKSIASDNKDRELPAARACRVMSLLGQTRRMGCVPVTSGLPRKRTSSDALACLKVQLQTSVGVRSCQTPDLTYQSSDPNSSPLVTTSKFP